MSRVILSKLNPDEIIHPDDSAVIKKMNRIPGFKRFLKKTIGNLHQAWANVTYTGNGYDITPESNPQMYGQLSEDCRILGLKEIPFLSVAWGYFISSRSVGGDKQRVILSSGAIDLLQPEELDFLLGHEIGHILCGHMPYHMLVETLYTPLFTDNSSVSLIDLIKLPMLEWYRISHYSADRMGLLACQDINVALRTMIKMSGLPKDCYDKIDIDAFVSQGDDFDFNHNNAMDKIVKVFSIISANSPWLVVRSKKLLEWYKSGEYQKIVQRH